MNKVMITESWRSVLKVASKIYNQFPVILEAAKTFYHGIKCLKIL